jgi:hypothetical protein
MPVRIEQHRSHWTDFHEIWYLRIFRKSVERIQVPLKSDTINGYFTWRPIYIYDYISLNFTFMWPCIVTDSFLIKPTDALNFPYLFCQETTCFGQFLCPSSGFFHCTFGTGICHQTFMTYTSAEYTVENCWWWAEELPDTCRVSWQNTFGKLLRLLVLLKRKKYITEFSLEWDMFHIKILEEIKIHFCVQ